MTTNHNLLPRIHIDNQPNLVKEGVFIFDGEVWSTQKRMARIYGRSIPTINDHLKKIQNLPPPHDKVSRAHDESPEQVFFVRLGNLAIFH